MFLQDAAKENFGRERKSRINIGTARTREPEGDVDDFSPPKLQPAFQTLLATGQQFQNGLSSSMIFPILKLSHWSNVVDGRKWWNDLTQFMKAYLRNSMQTSMLI